MVRREDDREARMSGPAAAPRRAEDTDAARELRELFDVHHRLVFAAAFRVTGSHDDAEDVLQSLFLRLAGAGIPPGLRDQPSAYLRRAAINGAIDLVRARNSERAAIERERRTAPADAPQAADPADREQRRRLRRRVRDALACLGARAAEMVALRYFEGLSNREIARLFETSEGTVAVTLHRARQRLRDELASSPEE